MEQKPKKLKYYFIEPTARFEIDSNNAAAKRMIYLHNFDYTRNAVAGYLTLNWYYRTPDLTYLHLKMYFQRLFSTGSLADLFIFEVDERDNKTNYPDFSKIENWAGFAAAEKAYIGAQAKGHLDLIEPGVIERFNKEKVARLRNQYESPKLMAGIQSVIEPLTDTVRNAGGQVVYYIPPGWSLSSLILEGHYDEFSKYAGVPMMTYDDPERYPVLFTLDTMWDFSHLNHNGAQLFTKQFAQDFIKRFLPQQ